MPVSNIFKEEDLTNDRSNTEIKRKLVEKSKLAANILRDVSKASVDYGIIEEGDKILVACSGGKDSYTLLWVLNKVKQRVPFDFEFVPFNIDPGFGGFKQDVVGQCIRSLGFEPVLVRENIGQVCNEKMSKDETACWMCARLRRGTLYTHAKKMGCNKLALGHHADDSIETLLLNLFYSSQIKAMPPKLLTDDGELQVIRPMIYVYEKDIKNFSEKMQFETVDCNCPNSKGEMDSQRAKVKEMLLQMENQIPELKNHMLASLKRVRLSHLLDKELFSFRDYE